MRELEAAGLGEIVAVPAPFCLAAQEAVAAWNFCGGYEIERLRLFEELHGLPDMELTIHLMSVIREHGN